MSAPPNDGDRFAVMTYADSQMAEADLIAFEARVAHDEALFEKVDRERSLRKRLRAHYDAVLEEPVPAALLDLLGMADAERAASEPEPEREPDAPTTSNEPVPAIRPHGPRLLELAPAPASASAVAPPPAAPRATGTAAWQAWGGMAACLVAGLALGARALAPGLAARTTPFAVDDRGDLVAAGPLRDALEERTGGASNADARGLAIGLSFRDKAQDWCRTFAVDSGAGIACKSGAAWRVAAFERAPAGDSSAAGDAADHGATPALSPTLLLQVDALRDGDTLAPGAEAAGRAGGWQR